MCIVILCFITQVFARAIKSSSQGCVLVSGTIIQNNNEPVFKFMKSHKYNKDNYVLVPHLKTNTICEAGTQFKTPTNIAGAIASNTYDFNCDGGMSQVLDLQAATSASTLTFSNPMEGNTYMLIVVQGSGLYNLVLPSGWWLNDTSPFDFTTLADNDRAMVTATYLGSTWYFAVKELTLV